MTYVKAARIILLIAFIGVAAYAAGYQRGAIREIDGCGARWSR